MTFSRTLFAALVCIAAAGAVDDALAAQRHFVASTGSDSNPCSIALPCRSFAAAALLVDPNGEILVHDTAGYGFVAITKSLSIISPSGVYAGISVFAAQDGITVNVPGGNVRLAGLWINGQGGGTGILVQQAARVTVEGCSVTNMAADGFGNAAASARIVIRNSVFRENAGAGITSAAAAEMTIDAVHADSNGGSGIALAGTKASISNSVSNDNGANGITLTASTGVQTTVAISDHKSSDNAGSGIDASHTGAGVVYATVSRSALSGNGQHGGHVLAGGQGQSRLIVADSQVAGNAVSGITAENLSALAVIHGNTITNNPVGVQGLATGLVHSIGNNSIRENTTNTGTGYATYAGA